MRSGKLCATLLAVFLRNSLEMRCSNVLPIKSTWSDKKILSKFIIVRFRTTFTYIFDMKICVFKVQVFQRL